MKAVLLKGYGGVDQLEYTDVPDPKPGAGEVLVKVISAGINPVDWKLRQGALKASMPLELPAILGRDAAGEVVAVGAGVTRWKQGDRVLGMVNRAYAELLTVKAEDLAGIPDGMSVEDAGALPLVLLTGAQLIELGVKPRGGQTVLVTGAVGNVGRTAVHVAKQRGAKVIAGVRASQRAEAASLGADRVVVIDTDAGIAEVGEVDAIADTVDHDVIEKLMPHIRKGGRLGTVLGKPAGADQHEIEVGEVWVKPDGQRLRKLAEDVLRGELNIPIAERFPLREVEKAQETAERGTSGKVLLLP